MPLQADNLPDLAALLDALADALAERVAARLAPAQAAPPAAGAVPEPLTLKLTEVARRLNVSRATAYELCRSGQLPSVRVGKLIHVTPRALERYIATREGRYADHPAVPARPVRPPIRRRPRSA